MSKRIKQVGMHNTYAVYAALDRLTTLICFSHKRKFLSPDVSGYFFHFYILLTWQSKYGNATLKQYNSWSPEV